MANDLDEPPSVVAGSQMQSNSANGESSMRGDGRKKLYGRAFWESLGSPRFILAPMVDQSEYAWRLLTRSFLPPSQQSSLLAYTPMIHARIFAEEPQSRSSYLDFRNPPIATDEISVSSISNPKNKGPTFLDGNTKDDRPLIAQFCANDPSALLAAAKRIEDHVDAVDLNLGCPQSIARKGHYGAFLQEDQDLIFRLVNTLHKELKVPVTAKIRILETKEKTLRYAQMLVRAGASIITVHGRRREQKGHNTGVADWSVIRYLREQIPHDVVMFANGNILRHEDIMECLDFTGVDGVMSAEGNLCDPSIFTSRPQSPDPSEYWIGRDGRGGWRMDAVLRRYLDIIYDNILQSNGPARKPLFVQAATKDPYTQAAENDQPLESSDEEPERKKRRRNEKTKVKSPSLCSIQAHLFHLLKPLISKHTHIRDKLARCRPGDMSALESVLRGVERAVRDGLKEYAISPEIFEGELLEKQMNPKKRAQVDALKESHLSSLTPEESSADTARKVRLPWWVCQPQVRPLPAEALALGSLQMSKREKCKMEAIQTQKSAIVADA